MDRRPWTMDRRPNQDPHRADEPTQNEHEQSVEWVQFQIHNTFFRVFSLEFDFATRIDW